MSKEQEIENFFRWRDGMNRKHRTMTVGEYMAWCRGGDAVSHPSNSNALRGGLTIILNTPPIIGKVGD
jgi:hypothetical protein